MTCTGMISYSPVAWGSLQDSSAELQKYRQLYEHAATAFKAGDIAGALMGFIDLCRLQPDIPGVRYAIAVCCVRLGKLQEAVAMLDAELLQPSPHPEARQLLRDLNKLNGESGPVSSGAELSAGAEVCFFTVPKAFKGHIDSIQRNAIKSWVLLEPKPQILLMGSEQGVADVAREYGLNHIQTIDCNEYGTPLVSSVFQKAEQCSKAKILVYINTDIIITPDFMRCIQLCQKRFSSFLMAGQRWNVDITSPVDFAIPSWVDVLKFRTFFSGTLHNASGIDYFAFTRGLYTDIPPFAIGRTAWDNWLLNFPIKNAVPVVNTTSENMIFHQNHDYSHTPPSLDAWTGPEAVNNQKLAGNNIGVLGSCTYLVQGDQIIPAEPLVEYNHEIALKLDPAEVMSLIEQGKYADASCHLSAITDSGYIISECCYLHGLCQLNMRNYTNAIALLNKELAINHDHAASLNLLKSAYRQHYIVDHELTVSIVIPTHNRAHTLPRAINSTIGQTYPIHEIIVVDDGSTDETESVVRKFKEQYQQVKYFKILKNGAQAARNEGIRQATGSWIAFLDSDDEYLPNKIERQMEVALREKVAVVHCECYVKYGDKPLELFGTPALCGHIFQDVLRTPGPTFPGLLARKDILEEVGLLDTNVPSFQEWDTAIRLAKDNVFGYVPEPLFVYYCHDGDTISKDMKRHALGYAYIVEKYAIDILMSAGKEALANHYRTLIQYGNDYGLPLKAQIYTQKLFALVSIGTRN